MSTFNPFKVGINSSSSQNNTFLSVQNRTNFNNNPFLSQENKSSSNNTVNPFISLNNNNNSVNNNRFISQNNNNNPFLSSSNNQNNRFSFSINNNDNNNNSVNFTNPFIGNNNNNNNINNPFTKNNNDDNKNFNNNIFKSNSNFLNNSLNISSNTNPFNKILNNDLNGQNNNPFLSINSGSNTNIFNNSGNSSIFNNNNQKNNIFLTTNNNFDNSTNNVSFGFNINKNDNNSMSNNNNFFLIKDNNNNINNNLFNNSKQFSSPFNNESNNKNVLIIQNNDNKSNNVIKTNMEKEDESKKLIPLSKLLTLRFQSVDFLEEVLSKFNEDKDRIKILTKSLNLNNYNDLIIETILSSKSKKEEEVKREKGEKLDLLNLKNRENKKRRERIINEKRYENHLKELYKKNEKDDINRIIKLNSQKININNNQEKNESKRNSMTSDYNKKDNEEKKDNKTSIVYKIFIKVYNDEKKKVLDKNIIIDQNHHYILDLDKLYNDITTILNVLKINCRFGLEYKLNNFIIQKDIRKINLLEFEIFGKFQTNNDYNKELEMEINIISEKISEREALLNPQLYLKNDKNYILNPSLEIINNSNLFKYNKGLEIILGNLTIVFSDKMEYDLTNVNLDELCYDGDKDIFFDDMNFKKEKSTFIKLYDKQVCLIYKGFEKKEKNIILKYLNKRYSTEFYDINDGKITLVTRVKNLFLSEKESKSNLSKD